MSRPILRETVETAILTLLIFVVMRALIQNYRIEGYSMEPNLHEQQYLIVNKVAYYLGEPKRGDIIVFEYPKGDPNGPERDYIKRIIGLPGEVVSLQQGEVYIDGQVLAEPYIQELCRTSRCQNQEWVLAENQYFVLGDNRNNSYDSASFGPITRDLIVGRAWINYWPPQEWQLFEHFDYEVR